MFVVTDDVPPRFVEWVDTSETSLAPSLTLGTSAAAFVSDTANLGATGPVQRERYRIEAAPTFGTIKFTSLLGDYRRYVMPVSFYTVAEIGRAHV